MPELRTEEIYDAALDSDSFGRLASSIAAALNARSGVLHWQSGDGQVSELSDTGYFSLEQMTAYDAHFSGADIWAEAVRATARVNRAWSTEQLLPAANYENSRIYNDWVRPMGDDTYHCIGAVIRGTWGTAELGFHRGRGQEPFDQRVVESLNRKLGHLGRMLEIRATLATAEQSRIASSSALDLLAPAVFFLALDGKLLHLNAAAQRLLEERDGLCLGQGRLVALARQDQLLLQSAISRAAAPSGTEGGAVLIHGSDGRGYILSVASACAGAGGRQIMIVANDRARPGRSAERMLRQWYQLTPAEAQVAVHLANGATPAEIAEERSTSLGSVRVQLKAVFAKLGCSRQAEVVALVKDLPRMLE